MGLVNRVVPEAELESYVKNYHRHDLRQRAAHHQGGQIHRRRSRQGRIASATSRDVRPSWSTPASPASDYIEGRRAFMEKRKPVFTGK